MSDNGNSPSDSGRLTRRDFVKTGAFLGGTTLAAAQVPWLFKAMGGSSAREITPSHEYELAKPESIIYTACLQCQVRCNLKVKLWDGIVVKIDGSPYSAKQLLPNIPYETSPADAAKIDGKLCPKGQAGIQTLYDPYRLRKVLKRAGPRGSGQWVTIDFDTAVDEIVNGGDLFGEGPVTGVKDIYTLRGSDGAKEEAK